MKICYKCKFEGNDDLFIKGRNSCKKCEIIRHNKYVARNVEKEKLRNCIKNKKVKILNRDNNIGNLTQEEFDFLTN